MSINPRFRKITRAGRPGWWTLEIYAGQKSRTLPNSPTTHLASTQECLEPELEVFRSRSGTEPAYLLSNRSNSSPSYNSVKSSFSISPLSPDTVFDFDYGRQIIKVLQDDGTVGVVTIPKPVHIKSKTTEDTGTQTEYISESTVDIEPKFDPDLVRTMLQWTTSVIVLATASTMPYNCPYHCFLTEAFFDSAFLKFESFSYKKFRSPFVATLDQIVQRNNSKSVAKFTRRFAGRNVGSVFELRRFKNLVGNRIRLVNYLMEWRWIKMVELLFLLRFTFVFFLLSINLAYIVKKKTNTLKILNTACLIL